MTFHIIGIGNKIPTFTREQQERIQHTRVFSGGKRHYDLVQQFLPKAHRWIQIQAPMKEVFKAYEQCTSPIVIFASGNPLFYGFANTLRNNYPKAEIHTAPYFSAIQLLANATNTNSNTLQTVSVHGRDWNALDTALLQQQPLLGVLTDTVKTPAAIAQRMLDYGYSNYKMSVGEDLEGPQEQIRTLTLSQATQLQFHPLNCVLLHKTAHRDLPFGIPDAQFTGLEGRPNMITKMPIRLTTLHCLALSTSSVLWDIGFCTGAVSIEAKLRYPKLEVIAFEKRPECEQIIAENQKRFGVPGIQVLMGDFFDQDLDPLPKPDAIFIGGHGGRLAELFIKITPFLQPNTTVVINTVKAASEEKFRAGCATIKYSITIEHQLTLDRYNTITILQAKKSGE